MQRDNTQVLVELTHSHFSSFMNGILRLYSLFGTFLKVYSHDFSALALMVYFFRRLFTVDELKLVLSLITVGFNFTLNTSAAESNADMLIKTTKSAEQKVQNNARLNSFTTCWTFKGWKLTSIPGFRFELMAFRRDFLKFSLLDSSESSSPPSSLCSFSNLSW